MHPEAYVACDRASCAAAAAVTLDADTVVSPGSFEAALHAAGGAVELVELLLAARAPSGFSVHRPPGHHAGAIAAMGFCLFNNVAVAAQYALDPRGLERVMILDWDVHHGNGTNDIFHASDRGAVRLDPPVAAVPRDRAGVRRRLGRGRGLHASTCRSRPGSGDGVFCSLVDHVVCRWPRSFAPQLDADLRRLRRPSRGPARRAR